MTSNKWEDRVMLEFEDFIEQYNEEMLRELRDVVNKWVEDKYKKEKLVIIDSLLQKRGKGHE